MLTRYCGKSLKATEDTIVSCEQNQGFVVHSIWVTNTHASDTKYTIRHVPKDQTSSSEFDLASNVPLESNTVTVFPTTTKIYLLPGDKLTAFAETAGRVSMFVYGDLSSV